MKKWLVLVVGFLLTSVVFADTLSPNVETLRVKHDKSPDIRIVGGVVCLTYGTVMLGTAVLIPRANMTGEIVGGSVASVAGLVLTF
jgi:hypothetical protein